MTDSSLSAKALADALDKRADALREETATEFPPDVVHAPQTASGPDGMPMAAPSGADVTPGVHVLVRQKIAEEFSELASHIRGTRKPSSKSKDDKKG